MSKVTADRRGSASARAIGLAIAAGVAVAVVRGPLADAHQRVKETSDVYALPPPSQVVTLSLGYRSALVDVLWAHVLVSQGLHTSERRRFENLSRFLDAINELEPTFREPYLATEWLFTFQAESTPREEVLKARAILERGTEVLPHDAEVWLAAGQFVTFIGSTYLSDPAERAQWRIDGARMMAHAADLGGSDASVGWQALAGAGILERAGERDAAIRIRQQALAANDDPELHDRLELELAKLGIEKQIDTVDQIRRRDLPFVDPTPFLILGPPVDLAACAGPDRAGTPACAFTWRDRAAREDALK